MSSNAYTTLTSPPIGTVKVLPSDLFPWSTPLTQILPLGIAFVVYFSKPLNVKVSAVLGHAGTPGCICGCPGSADCPENKAPNPPGIAEFAKNNPIIIMANQAAPAPFLFIILVKPSIVYISSLSTNKQNSNFSHGFNFSHKLVDSLLRPSPKQDEDC